MRAPRLPLVVVLLGAAALGGCAQDDGPSVRAEPVETTTSSSSTSSSSTSTTSTSLAPTATATPVPDGFQAVELGGLRLLVPADWPVHDLEAAPETCVRADVHAVYLGEQGETPDCSAQAVGRTETLWVAPLTDRRQLDAARATQAMSINGIPARVDPDPRINGALTVIFTDQQLLVIITFGDAKAVADDILASVSTGGG